MIIRKQGDLKIGKRLKIFQKWEESVLTSDLAEIAKDHFKKGFPSSSSARGGGQTNDSRGGWRKRSERYSHPVLRDTGRLFNSIKVKKHRKYSLVLSDVKYAGYVNKVREFIGESRELDNKSLKFIKNELDSIFKSRNPRNRR